MDHPTSVLSAGPAGHPSVRIAAAGDLHVDASRADAAATALAAMAEDADVVLLAGDLTTHGEPAQAAFVADACRGLDVPVVTVLGNHDLHVDRGAEFAAVLRDAGVVVLDTEQPTAIVGECRVGVAGVKGFVGGFGGHTLPDFGERSLRELHAETGREVAALEAGLHEIATCPLRVALMHYAPTCETLVGEPPEIWSFLGSERLAAPVLEHRPDLVLHGHAHAGRLHGTIQGVPVYNVSLPVMGQDYWLFDLVATRSVPSSLH
ncbi:MAG: metallophosphoesterase [Solirubrobacterales bacterium]|nr:metallophosphoesterase [Solirubrobacterales bacterium]